MSTIVDRGRDDRAGVRLHQRLPRHGQRDGHLDRHRGAAAPRSPCSSPASSTSSARSCRSRSRKTISSGLVDDTQITPAVIFAGLVGAILWNLLTWLLGLPSSSSHALFGGLIGATWVAAGPTRSSSPSVVSKVLLPLVALADHRRRHRADRDLPRLPDHRARATDGTVTRGFKFGQIVSASMVALAHGTNDAQKTMGIITLTLITAGPAAGGRRPAVLGDPLRGPRDRARHRASAGGGSSRPSASGSARSRARRASPPRPAARPSS